MANNTIWVNGVSPKLIQTNNTKDGKAITNLSFPVDKTVSLTGYASVSVFSDKMVKPATNKDGVAIVSKATGEQLLNVGLGAPDSKRQVSVVTAIDAKGTKTYGKIEMTNAEIKAAYEASRQAYRNTAAATAQA